MAAAYNETSLRADFLDPFFATLGWELNANFRSVREMERTTIAGDYSLGRRLSEFEMRS
jgi:hypothetical protein